MTARCYQVVSAFQVCKRLACSRVDYTAQRGIDRQQWTCFGSVQSHDAIEPLGPVALQVNSNPQIQSDLPGQLIGVAHVECFVKVLVGCSGWLHKTAAIPGAQQESRKTVPRLAWCCSGCCGTRRRSVDYSRSSGGIVTVGGVCCRHLGIELQEASRIVALVVVVTEQTKLKASFEIVLAHNVRHHGIEAQRVVPSADTTASSLGAPAATPVVVPIGI